MNAFRYNHWRLLSALPLEAPFEPATLEEVCAGDGPIYLVVRADARRHTAVWHLQHPAELIRTDRGLWLLSQKEIHAVDVSAVDPRLIEAVKAGRVWAVNQNWDNWLVLAEEATRGVRRPTRIQLAALGNVGSTALLSLALLAKDDVAHIGVYDPNEPLTARWVAEVNQCAWPFQPRDIPPVYMLSEERLFEDCDVFIFAATAGIMAPGQEKGDVRQLQYEQNSRLVAHYAALARDQGFNGLFVILSDPVERLCQAALRAGGPDGEVATARDLRPGQIVGSGLGVMHSRALVAASQSPEEDAARRYLSHGRAFGCHGDDLVLANDPSFYDDRASQRLSETVRHMNMNVRALGYKPYVAPAVSSGAMALLSMIRGDWHYSTVFLDGIHYGCANRRVGLSPDVEATQMDEALFARIHESFRHLKELVADDEKRECGGR